MKIHEYQARDLLHHAGAPVPPGAMVETVDDAVAETQRILESGAGLVVIKPSHPVFVGQAFPIPPCESNEG